MLLEDIEETDDLYVSVVMVYIEASWFKIADNAMVFMEFLCQKILYCDPSTFIPVPFAILSYARST